MVDDKLSDGNESGGMVGTDNGGNPTEINLQFTDNKNTYPVMCTTACQRQRVAPRSTLNLAGYSLNEELIDQLTTINF